MGHACQERADNMSAAGGARATDVRRTWAQAGAVAGTSVDTVLYPLDTIKTRLQSGQAFGGRELRTRLFAGLRSAVAGSAPSAALFFVTYDSVKRALAARSGGDGDSGAARVRHHMLAASLGEMAACIVRVPTDVVKQRLQAGRNAGYADTVRHLWQAAGPRAFYLGLLPTVMRDVCLGRRRRTTGGPGARAFPRRDRSELLTPPQAGGGGIPTRSRPIRRGQVPFTCIQFPLYEAMKVCHALPGRALGGGPGAN